MTLYLFVQPRSADTHWNALTLRGIREALRRKECGVIEREFDGKTAPPDLLPGAVAVCAGVSLAWMKRAGSTLSAAGARAVFTGCTPENGVAAAGFVSSDHARAMEGLIGDFAARGYARPMLLGINADSAADRVKERVFLRSGRSPEDVFPFRGRMREVCAAATERMEHYDWILCANSLAARLMIKVLEERGDPVPPMAAFADVSHGRVRPAFLTVAEVDMAGIGRRAVIAAEKLAKDPELSSLTILVNCPVQSLLLPRERRGSPGRDGLRKEEGEASFNLYADGALAEVMQAEKILSAADSLDLEILSMLRDDRGNAEMAEALFTSESTVKYRVRRMLGLAGLPDRKALARLMASYLP